MLTEVIVQCFRHGAYFTFWKCCNKNDKWFYQMRAQDFNKGM